MSNRPKKEKITTIITMSPLVLEAGLDQAFIIKQAA
jgi:hypothetical protein